MPRYVILKHEISGSAHFDFMLEEGGALKTWSLSQAPKPGFEIEVKALGDHRLVYLEYEGPLSGDRGSVARWDQGTYEVQQQSEAEWNIHLKGEKLQGRALLRKISDLEDGWRFSFNL